MYGRLCEPWPLEGCCDFVELGIAPAVTGVAHEAATEILWLATGKQFGNCEVTLRPCRRDCSDAWPADTMWFGGIIDTHWGYPWPALVGGAWLNLACGACIGDCSCSTTSEVLFPEVVQRVVEVRVDGSPLVSGVDYTLYDHQRLVRLNGAQWPTCQDWGVTGGPGTFFTTVVFGAEVPALGRLAAAKLTCEIAKFCAGQDCSIPPNTIQVSRQGVTMVSSAVKDNLTGVFLADLFIKRFNPRGLQDRARAYSPDRVLPRITE